GVANDRSHSGCEAQLPLRYRYTDVTSARERLPWYFHIARSAAWQRGAWGNPLRRPGPMMMRYSIPLGFCLFFTVPTAALAQPTDKPWFRDATKEYGAIGDGPPAFADLDGDGFPDLICGGKVFKNEGGK